MRIGKRKLAHIEIFEIAAYIAEDNVDAAARFFNAVERTLDRIAEVPKIGRMQKFRDQGDLRMWPVKGFPKVLIFYIATPDEIDVVRVIHSARDFHRIFDEETD